LADLIIVLRTKSAVETFSGNMHFSLGAGLSAAAGTIGRAAEADVCAGDGGYAACYTYSCSKG
jgi:lipid-binding SYLF domain-containing protein